LVSLPLVNLWTKKSLILHFAILNIKTRFNNTYFGILWAALEPMLYFIVLYLVFTGIRDQGETFAIYLITGVMIFHIFVRGTMGGLGSLTGNAGLIKSLNIQKEFFPVVSTISVGILALVDVAVFFSLMPIFQFVPGWTLALLPIPLGLLLILILGLSYMLSIITVYARDIQFIWSIFSHSLLFVSPIFWSLDNVGGILPQIQKINPLGQLIEIAHSLVIYKQIPPLNDWIYTTAFVLVIFFVGYFTLRKLEYKITEEF